MKTLKMVNQASSTVNLGPVSLIPIGEGKSFSVASLEVAVFRTRTGDLYATQARCSHRGGPLADGNLGGTIVQCPLHGYKFDLTCGSPVGNDCRPIQTLRVEASPSGDILLHLPAVKPAAAQEHAQP